MVGSGRSHLGDVTDTAKYAHNALLLLLVLGLVAAGWLRTRSSLPVRV